MSFLPPNVASRRALLALAILALLPSFARAESAPQIEKVRIGLPSGKGGTEGGLSRNGSWAPVFVTVKGTTEGNTRGGYRISIETVDVEETPYRSFAIVPALGPGEERIVQVYVVPGSTTSDFIVRLEKLVKADPPTWEKIVELPRQSRDSIEDVVGVPDVLLLGVGPGLSGLRRIAEQPIPEGKEKNAAKKKQQVEREVIRQRFAFAETVQGLPDRWIGYDAVDVVVLATGKTQGTKSLVEELLQDDVRRDALREWVRRGGRVIVSVGSNQQLVAELFKRMPLLDCEVTGSHPALDLTNLATWLNLPAQDSLRKIEVAKLERGSGTDLIVPEDTDSPDVKAPLIVHGSCGLGRVAIVAFDLDAPPFTTWSGQKAFWNKLLAELVPALAGDRQRALGEGGDMRGELKRGLENQGDDVPVISFGWVALFILLYVALVGPIDYLILKKLFKRLELTWVTFPTIVLLVSVAAYAGAWALKGDELRINKVDLIEIDLHPSKQSPRRVYGNTWFSLFSPRIQTYVVGIEPATPGWGARAPERSTFGSRPVLMMLEGTDRGMRTGSQGLFPRPYEYAEDDSGVRGVPVPVWATRSFTANWTTPIDPKAPPIDVRDVDEVGESGALRVSAIDQRLIGRITNNLPVELQKVSLFYRDRVYDLGTLPPGGTIRIDPLQGGPIQPWFKVHSKEERERSALWPVDSQAPFGRTLPDEFRYARSAFQLMPKMMFYKASANRFYDQDVAMRGLDQSWRLERLPDYRRAGPERYRDEAILVARTPMLSAPAEQISEHGISASRLWLGALPGPEPGERPAIRGTVTQETFVRAYLPVVSTERKR